MPVHNGTGVLRKVMLCPSTFYELVPVDDFARTALERGDKVDHDKARAQHEELADIYRDAGVEVCTIEEPDPTRHYGVNARDFAVNSPGGVVIGRFKYSERRGEEVPGEKWTTALLPGRKLRLYNLRSSRGESESSAVAGKAETISISTTRTSRPAPVSEAPSGREIHRNRPLPRERAGALQASGGEGGKSASRAPRARRPDARPSSLPLIARPDLRG